MATAILRSFDGRGQTFADRLRGDAAAAQRLHGLGLRPARADGSQLRAAARWSTISGAIWIFGGFVARSRTRACCSGRWPRPSTWLRRCSASGCRSPARTRMSDWTLAGGHLAERCQLLLMIAFGESFLRIGESFAPSTARSRLTTGFLVGFVLVFALWTVYFLHHAERAARTVAAGRRERGAARALRLHVRARGDGRRPCSSSSVAIHEVIEAPKTERGRRLRGDLCRRPGALPDRVRALQALARPRGRAQWALRAWPGWRSSGSATAFGSAAGRADRASPRWRSLVSLWAAALRSSDAARRLSHSSLIWYAITYRTQQRTEAPAARSDRLRASPTRTGGSYAL